MLKPRAFNIFIYLIVKHILFFIVLAFIGGRYKSLVIKISADTQELIMNTLYYSFYPFVYTILGAAVFFGPIYLAFKSKNLAYFILIMAIILVAEYYLYTYLASSAEPMNGIYNGALSVLLLLVFFIDRLSS